MDYTAESKNVNQMDFVYDLFKDFIESDEGYDFEFDNGLVCRWLNGTAKLSPRITSYYAKNGNIEVILSIIVGTFSSNIHTLMRSYLRSHSTAAS